MPLPPAVSVTWSLSQSGVGAPYGWNTSNNGNTIRFDVENSSNCGGPNGNIQQGTAAATLFAPARFNMNVALTGLGESQDPGYENMTLRFNSTAVISATSAGGGQGCAAGVSINATTLVAQPYFIAKNSNNTFQLDFTTRDNLFHVGCFYQCDLSFTLLDPPVINSFTANPNPQTSANGIPQSDTNFTWNTFGAETLTITPDVGELDAVSGTVNHVTGLQSVVGSNSPASQIYTLTATNVAGSTSAVVEIQVYNDNISTNTWTTSFSNLEPNTQVDLVLGTLAGVDMPTTISTTGSGNFVSAGTQFAGSVNFNVGQNVILRTTTLPLNLDLTGETGLYGKPNTKVVTVTTPGGSFDVNVTTRPPVIGEDFDFPNNLNKYPYEDIDLISNNPTEYLTSPVIDVDDVDIPVEIKVDKADAQIRVNGGAWQDVREI